MSGLSISPYCTGRHLQPAFRRSTAGAALSVAALVSVFPAALAAEVRPSGKLEFLQLKMPFCSVRQIRLNDLPLLDGEETVGGALMVMVSDKLIAGPNRLTFEVVDEPGARNDCETIEARIVSQHEESPGKAVASPGRSIGVWSRPGKAKGSGFIPAQVSFIESARQTEPWAWQRGQLVASLSDADKRDIASLVQRLSKALAERDLTHVLDLLETKDRDFAAASGLTPEATRREQGKFIREELFPTVGRLVAVDANDITYKPVANGHAYQLKTGSGEEIIRGTKGKDGVRFSFPLTVSRIVGVWTIVR